MPTGYTADIDEVDFNGFVMRCARNFGAMIDMRGEPWDAKIPERFEPHISYHDEKLKEYKELKDIIGLEKLDETKLRCNADYENKLARYNERIREAFELKDKYNNMLSEVIRWQPPSEDHVKLKDFMIQQLESSIDFDCDSTIKYAKKPEYLTLYEWFEKEMESIDWHIEYHTKEREKEIERTEQRNEWLRLLRESLN